jgi:hypothetical protein
MYASFQNTFICKDVGFISNENENEEMTKSAKRPKTQGLAFVRKSATFVLKENKKWSKDLLS